MKRVIVLLHPDIYSKLRDLAVRERRSATAQLKYILAYYYQHPKEAKSEAAEDDHSW